jgi:hypothetical protein
VNKAAGLTAMKQEELKACAVSGPESSGPKKVCQTTTLASCFAVSFIILTVFHRNSRSNLLSLRFASQVDREAEAAERKKKLRELRAQKSTESQASAATVDEAVA